MHAPYGGSRTIEHIDSAHTAMVVGFDMSDAPGNSCGAVGWGGLQSLGKSLIGTLDLR